MYKLLLTGILFLCSANHASAQTFQLYRPIADSIQINGRYLFGEPNINGNEYAAHGGVDVDIVFDTVYAAHSGKISYAGTSGSCGTHISIDGYLYNDKMMTIYCHLDELLVNKGDSVTAGNPIGISGETGNVTGPHLHFEVQLGHHNADEYKAPRRRKNPELFIAMEGMGAIYGFVPGAPYSTKVEIFPDPKPRPPYNTYSYSLTYRFSDTGIGSHPHYNENYAIGDVEPGEYLITSINGYRREVVVEAGMITNADADYTSNEEENSQIASKISLNQNYPNPFNPNTKISFEIPNFSFINLSVYDILGKKVAELVNEPKAAGFYEVNFDASELAGGVYIYRLKANGHEITKKLTLVK